MSNGQTALVVDDDPDIRTIVRKYLEGLGYAVTEAGDGRSTIKLLDAARPTLLCLDLMLPESSGFDVCEHIAKEQHLQGLPIIVISARSMPEDRAMAEEMGVRIYLEKPFTHAEFNDAVHDALTEGAA